MKILNISFFIVIIMLSFSQFSYSDTVTKYNIDSIDKYFKSLNYKGLNTKFGIGRFLYYAAKNGVLEDGLNQVFWTQLSEKDKRVDQKWQLVQVTSDNWELYEINELHGNEVINLIIAIPENTNRLQIIGQRLRDSFFVFRGNQRFTTTNGGIMVVQVFDPIELNLLNFLK